MRRANEGNSKKIIIQSFMQIELNVKNISSQPKRNSFESRWVFYSLANNAVLLFFLCPTASENRTDWAFDECVI